MRAERLTRAAESSALEYLSRSPYLNVFITDVLLHDRPARGRDNVVVASDGDGVCGVAYFGRQVAIAAEAQAVPAFAEHAKRRRGERMIIGERAIVHAFWQLVAHWHSKPRLVRERQHVMMVDRRRLHAYPRHAFVRHALPEDVADVAGGSAQMVRQELAVDPRRRSTDFSASVAQMIERKLWWVGIADGRICFMCNVGPWCDRTVQLQGIWTPPALRGRGFATASLGAICERLLEFSPTVSLYVNDFNEKAIALYRRVGFEHVGDFQTILF